MLNRLRAIWPKANQRGIRRLQVRILGKDNFCALLVLSSRRSGGSYLGFRASSFSPDSPKTIKTLKL